jgi:hypothetical protein
MEEFGRRWYKYEFEFETMGLSGPTTTTRRSISGTHTGWHLADPGETSPKCTTRSPWSMESAAQVPSLLYDDVEEWK